MQAAIARGDVPRTAPAYKDLLVDDRGRMWVSVTTDDDVVVRGETGLAWTSARRGPGGEPALVPWWVFDAAGRRAAVAMLPPSVRLWQVRGGWAYGIDTDADGVQRVVRYVVSF
jgi:hypothetical protein